MEQKFQPVAETPRTEAVKNEPHRVKRFLKMLGPGLITGASDDDPSGIGTYSQAGAQLGFACLWTALFTFPLMTAVQYMCAKIGIVSGHGLAGVIRQTFPRPVLYASVTILVLANVLNAAADLGAMADSIHILVPQIPAHASILWLGLIMLGVLVFGSYKHIAGTFKWLTLTLFAYIIASFLMHPHWPSVLKHTFVPSLSVNKSFLAVLVGIFGTTISPYLFFWQTSNEVEEEREAGRSIWRRMGATEDDLKYAAVDVSVGMFVSNLVMYFIILGTASALWMTGQRHIATANDAALALRPLAGQFAAVLFAAGIIGTGFLAVPVLIGSCAFALSETFGWRRGLNTPWFRAREFYAVITVSFVIAMGLNYFHFNAMDALFWAAILNGVLAPPLLVVVMLISNNRSVLGDKVNSLPLNVVGWTVTALMSLAAAGLIASTFWK